MNFLKRNLESLFWFFVLVSWVPLITGVAILPGGHVRINNMNISGVVMPEARLFGNEFVTTLTLIFIAFLPITYFLRKWTFFDKSRQRLLVNNVNSRKAIQHLPTHEVNEIKRNLPKYLLAMLPMVTSILIPKFANGAVAEGILPGVFYSLYVTSILLSFYIYMRNAHLISTPFIIFLGILFFDAAALNISHWLQYNSQDSIILNHYSVLGFFYDSYVIDLFKVLIFFLGIALLRLIYLFFADNQLFFKEADKKELKKDAALTVKLWWPMLVLFAVFTILYNMAYSRAIQPAMVKQILDCSEMESIPAKENDGYRPFAECESEMKKAGNFISIQEALDKANARRMSILNTKTKDAINRANFKAQAGVESAAEQIHRDVRSTVPKRLPGTKTRSCGINIVCLVENGIKSAINSAYVAVKNRQLNRLRSRLNEIEQVTVKEGGDFATAARKEVAAQFAMLEHINKRAIDGTSHSLKALSLIMLLYSLFILLKTFGIVFSRVWFRMDSSNNVTFKKETDLPVYGKPQQVGKSTPYKIKKVDGVLYCTRSHCTMTGVPDDKVVPQPWMGFLTRILHRQRSMLRLDPTMAETRIPITLTVTNPNQLVTWKLAPGERVIFSFADFVAMSESIKIERRVSLSIYTLIFGKFIQYCAYCPKGSGLLILRTLDEPDIVDQHKKQQVAPLYLPNMIAWNVFTNFSVSAALNANNTLWSAERVGPNNQSSDIALMDRSDKRHKGMARGILRFVKTFVLPF